MAVSAPISPARSTIFTPSPNVKPKSRISRATTTSAADDDVTAHGEGEGEGDPLTGPNSETRSETSSVASLDTLANLIKWVPGSNQELFDAEDKLLANVKVPHELVHVSIGPAPNVKQRVVNEAACKEITRVGGYMNMLPIFTHILPRITVSSAAKTIAQNVVPGWRSEENQTCYINTLLVGDVARSFAEMHRPSSVGDLSSLISMEQECEDRDRDRNSDTSPEGRAVDQAASMAGTREKPTGSASAQSQSSSMAQRLWNSLLPLSVKTASPQKRANPSLTASLDADSIKADLVSDWREEGASDKNNEENSASGDKPETLGPESPLREGDDPSPDSPNSDEIPNSPNSDDFFEAETPRWAKGGSEKKNLVMVHGYAACIGFFFRNFETLSEHFNVYAVDQLGWGASSRPSFTPESAEEAESWFVEALELWRQEVGLQKFILLGHSFGGFISSKYALKYSEHVEHLILVGPAGFNHVSPKMHKFRQTWKGYLLGMVWETNLTPQLMLKFLGPWSEEFVKRSVVQRWSNLPEGQENMEPGQVKTFAEYIFQSLIAPMSGELCMKHVFSLGAFARRPLIDRAKDWKAPTSFIYGVDDIMDYRAGLGAAKVMPVPAEVLLVQEAGHMLFLEKPTLFNQAVIHSCRDLLPAGSAAVAEATKAVASSIVPLTQCHGIPDGDSDALFCSQGPGRGMVRLASGWGIG